VFFYGLGYILRQRSFRSAYENKGDYDRAIADLTRAAELDQNFQAAYYNRGIIYSRKGDYDRAIVDFTWAIKVDPNYASAYYHRGIAYEAKGDRQRAKEDFAVERKLTVSDPAVSVRDRIGDLNAHQSVKHLRLVELGAIEKSPHSFGYILYKAASYAIQGGEVYSQDDYYYYPLKEWDDEKLLDGVNQVLNSYEGYSPKYPLENMSMVDICNLFELFHYSFLNFEEIAADMYRFNFRHKVHGDTHTVYLKNTEPQDMSITELYFLIAVENTLIKMCEYKNSVIKILTEDHDLGIDAEYAWIYFRYPEYERTLQTLVVINSSGQFEKLAERIYNKTPPVMKWNGQNVKVRDDTYYDVLTIENGKDTKDIVFDISDFFHNPMRGENFTDDE
jgi:hypothetical protein